MSNNTITSRDWPRTLSRNSADALLGGTVVRVETDCIVIEKGKERLSVYLSAREIQSINEIVGERAQEKQKGKDAAQA
jgi:hypothetical protein